MDPRRKRGRDGGPDEAWAPPAKEKKDKKGGVLTATPRHSQGNMLRSKSYSKRKGKEIHSCNR